MSQCRSLAVRSVTMLPAGDCSWTWAAHGERDRVVEPQSEGGQGLGYAVDPFAPCQGCKFRDGVVHLGAYAVRTGNFPEHPGDLSAHRG